MNLETFSVIVVFTLLFSAIVFIFVNSSKREKKSRTANFAVNNSIANLIMNDAITIKTFSKDNLVITCGSGAPKNNYEDMIMNIGFNGEPDISAKAFHENLYANHDLLIQDLNQAVSFHHIDVETTPEKRVEEGKALRNILPFLILGDMQGNDGAPGNPKYVKDEDYIGYMLGSSNVIMSTTMI